MAIDPFEGIRTEKPGTKVVQDRAQENQLDKDAFLKIFLAQLQAQDPLNPQDSSQLSSQLAQFSQLEQSVQTTEAIGKLGDKLDDLIDATGGKGRIDPVSLIGRQIDFPADELRAEPTGTTAPLQIPLPESPAHTGMLVEVQDLGSGQRGLLALTSERAKKTGEFPPLPPGDYQMQFENGQPKLTGPAALNGFPVKSTGFRLLTVNEAGEAVLDPAHDQAFPFSPGQRYRFTVRAVNANDGGEPTEIDLSRSASVTSVRIRDGQALAVADGVEVDPSRIKGIR